MADKKPSEVIAETAAEAHDRLNDAAKGAGERYQRVAEEMRREAERATKAAREKVDGAVAGIYDMGVLSSARRRGLGRALTLAAVARAREAGCASVTLNATGEGEALYRSVGFESLGLGMTWWLFPRP